jgi:hypothetical protein
MQPETQPETQEEEAQEEETQDLAAPDVSDVQYDATEVGSIAAQLTLSIDFASLVEGTPERAAFETQFREDVAAALGGIDTGRVRIKSIRAGSTVVDFLVLPSYDGTAMAATVMTEAFSSDGILIAGSSTTSGVTNIAVVTEDMIATPPTPSPASEQQQAPQLEVTILNLVVIGLGVLVVVCGCLVVVCGYDAYVRNPKRAAAAAAAPASAPGLKPEDTAETGVPPTADEPEPEPEPDRLSDCEPGNDTHTVANSQLQNTWMKKQDYELIQLVSVQKIYNPRLQERYDDYKKRVGSGEQLVFHGCSDTAIDPDSPDSILTRGFLKKYWKTSTGSWQRFGPGFYFALQSSKSHEYPLTQMKNLRAGEHQRSMLLCKVAPGRILKTDQNMDGLAGAAPAGYDSIHGIGDPMVSLSSMPMNYDELVLYHEEAVLPYAIVTYDYRKKQSP